MMSVLSTIFQQSLVILGFVPGSRQIGRVVADISVCVHCTIE